MKYLILLSGLVLSILTSCSGGSRFRFEEGVAWNTVYHITYRSDKDLSDSIIRVFDKIDRSLSPFNPESTVSKINDNRTTLVDSHFKTVYEESLKIHRESGGSFDPTLSPLIRAWGFGQGHVVGADTLRLDSLLAFVGIGKTDLKGLSLVKADPRTEFNFSALAKGYGVDCIADMLTRNGVEDYLVEVGGEIRTAGQNPSGTLWTIGIDSPDSEAPSGETVLNIAVGDAAVATSGNYRNYQDLPGKRIGHTISPFTGRPVESDVVSATVVTSTCMEADALATACMVLGSEEALNLCTRLRAAVMLVKSDMSVEMNPPFRSLTHQSGSLEE